MGGNIAGLGDNNIEGGIWPFPRDRIYKNQVGLENEMRYPLTCRQLKHLHFLSKVLFVTLLGLEVVDVTFHF